ncbi:MAG: hypothetical protein K2G90_03075, partial [Muribaculaceae bacterium]|nr:hypothetical protein [Muribaculaceae bacterium]
LINGLLLLAVATSGASVFTSCKDNEDSLQAELLKNQKDLAKALQDKDAELARRIKKLQDGDYLTLADREYLLGLIEDNNNSLEAVKAYLDSKIASMVTSIEIQRVYNNMFGTLNLPFGINSTVLANYYYEAKDAVTFPNTDDAARAQGEYNSANPDVESVNAWDLNIEPEGVINLPANKVVFDNPDATEGSLGKIYVQVNPSNVPAAGLPVTLVTSKEGKAVKTTLELKEAEEIEFTFGGGTRSAANGLYVIDVPFTAEDLDNIKVTIDEGLKQAVKDFYHDQSKANLANIAKGVYDQLVDTNLPAYALKLGYVNNPQTLAQTLVSIPGATMGADGVVRDDAGNIVYDPNDETGSINSSAVSATEAADLAYNYLYSKYEIAVAAMNPLSFGTAQGVSFDHELPSFGRIKDAINDYFDKMKDKLYLTLGDDNWKIEIDKDAFTVNFDGKIEIDLTGAPIVDAAGNPTGDKLGDVKIILTKDGKGDVEGATYASLKDLIDAMQGSLDNVQGVVDQVNDIIKDINGQLKDVNKQIQDAISDVQNDFNDKFDSNSKLIDLYNDVIDRVNSFLKDPNHYLQVYAAYKENNGGLHHFSTDVNDPSVYSGTEGFKVFLTSYNGEILVPAYKKILTVSNVYKNGSVASNAESLLKKANGGDDINTVLDGERHVVEIEASNLEKGYTYELFYSALDYRGVTSSRKFYIEVK